MSKKHLKILFLLLGFFLLFLFFRQVKFVDITSILTKVRWKFSGLLVVTLLGYLLATYAWYYSFKEIKLHHVISRLFKYRMIGETLATINPTSVIAGDAAKIYFLKRDGVSVDEATSATLISRVVIFVSLICLLVTTSSFFLNSFHQLNSIGNRILLIIVFPAIAFLSIWILVSPRLILYRLILFIGKILKKDINTQANKIKEINKLTSNFFLKHRRKFILTFILSGLHWFGGALEFYIILNFLEIEISLLDATLIEMGVILIKSLGAFIPGQIGVEEYGNSIMLSSLGVTHPEIWVSVSLLRRARQVFWIIVGVLLYMIWAKSNKT